MRDAAAWSRPPSDDRIAEGDVRVWLGMLDELDIEPLATLLSVDEHARAAKFVFDRDRRRFVVARGLLRRLLAGHLQTDPRDLRFTYDRFGKPSVAAPASALTFNVSHSGAAAVFALGRAGALGVDIEALRPMPDAADIAERFFASGEREALRALPPAHRERAFFHCWTRKEAFIKAVGQGLSHPLDSFEVTVKPDEPVRVIASGDGSADPAPDWTLLALPAIPGYVGALAVGGRPRAVHYHAWADGVPDHGLETPVP